ncbi:MAG: hypothetical protein KJP23_20385, partial [Deltaproteobacteria bacterium]|nr:hypothetical protein [Deltaproteobacteria bacterium]
MKNEVKSVKKNIMACSDSKIKAPFKTRNAHRATRNPDAWLSIDFDLVEYRDAWALQEKLIMARRAGLLQNDLVLFLEHPPVFTLGRRGGR